MRDCFMLCSSKGYVARHSHKSVEYIHMEPWPGELQTPLRTFIVHAVSDDPDRKSLTISQGSGANPTSGARRRIRNKLGNTSLAAMELSVRVMA